MKKFPVGIQTFFELIQKNYVYVDKTKHIYDLITTGKYYFFARPRRFGKSLLVSTLAEIFSGNKRLFTDFFIYSSDYDWKKHPVIKIAFSDIPCSTPEELEEGIILHLNIIAKKYGVILEHDGLPSQMLQELVRNLSKNNKVVLLIDEYDYPILQHVSDVEMADKMCDVLNNFYAVIQGLDKYFEFVFVVGVGRIPTRSIYSVLDYLEDISSRYKDLL
jgi:Predicted AAA-ATPase